MSELLNASSTLTFSDKIKDCKSYRKLVKKAAYSSALQPILGIRSSDGDIETSD